MNTLVATQELFLRCVRFDPAPAELENVFAASPRLSARDCMNVYRQMYWYRLVDALFDVFPRVVDLLGKARFTELACRYLAGAPSRHPELERLGWAFPSFLSESEGDRSSLDHASDVARLEYASLEVLLAPDHAAVAITDIDAATFPRQAIRFSPAMAVIDVSAEAAAAFDGALSSTDALSAEPRRSILVWRQRFGVHHRALARDEADALTSARAGHPLAEVCAFFDSPERASEILRFWFEASLVGELKEFP